MNPINVIQIQIHGFVRLDLPARLHGIPRRLPLTEQKTFSCCNTLNIVCLSNKSTAKSCLHKQE